MGMSLCRRKFIFFLIILSLCSRGTFSFTRFFPRYFHCPRNEQYTSCVVACNNCELKGQCKQYFCLSGCDCIPGYFRDHLGHCVPEERCGQVSCRQNEEFTICVIPCNDCKLRGRCQFYEQECFPGCDCVKGHFRDEHGVCIPEDHCQTREHCTKPHERYYECMPTCRNTCENYQTNHPCFYSCNPGCSCIEGYLKNNQGECVRIQECPKPEYYNEASPSKEHGGYTCSKTNEKYYRCMPTCDSTCDNYGFHQLCTYDCRPGCFCIDGLIWNDAGHCVKPMECLTAWPCSKPHERYYECSPNCHNTCENHNSNSPCIIQCTAGCYCTKGYVRNNNGDCVKPTECKAQQPGCAKDEQYYGCKPDCKNTCKNYFNPQARCHKICTPGCFCAAELVRNEDGFCIYPEECDKVKCPPNEEFYSCMPSCTNTCDSHRGEPYLCSSLCKAGCFCRQGLLRRSDGECVPPEECGFNGPSLFGRSGGEGVENGETTDIAVADNSFEERAPAPDNTGNIDSDVLGQSEGNTPPEDNTREIVQQTIIMEPVTEPINAIDTPGKEHADIPGSSGNTDSDVFGRSGENVPSENNASEVVPTESFIEPFSESPALFTRSSSPVTFTPSHDNNSTIVTTISEPSVTRPQVETGQSTQSDLFGRSGDSNSNKSQTDGSQFTTIAHSLDTSIAVPTEGSTDDFPSNEVVSPHMPRNQNSSSDALSRSGFSDSFSLETSTDSIITESTSTFVSPNTATMAVTKARAIETTTTAMHVTKTIFRDTEDRKISDTVTTPSLSDSHEEEKGEIHPLGSITPAPASAHEERERNDSSKRGSTTDMVSPPSPTSMDPPRKNTTTSKPKVRTSATLTNVTKPTRRPITDTNQSNRTIGKPKPNRVRPRTRNRNITQKSNKNTTGRRRKPGTAATRIVTGTSPSGSKTKVNVNITTAPPEILQPTKDSKRKEQEGNETSIFNRSGSIGNGSKSVDLPKSTLSPHKLDINDTDTHSNVSKIVTTTSNLPVTTATSLEINTMPGITKEINETDRSIASRRFNETLKDDELISSTTETVDGTVDDILPNGFSDTHDGSTNTVSISAPTETSDSDVRGSTVVKKETQTTSPIATVMSDKDTNARETALTSPGELPPATISRNDTRATVSKEVTEDDMVTVVSTSADDSTTATITGKTTISSVIHQRNFQEPVSENDSSPISSTTTKDAEDNDGTSLTPHENRTENFTDFPYIQPRNLLYQNTTTKNTTDAATLPIANDTASTAASYLDPNEFSIIPRHGHTDPTTTDDATMTTKITDGSFITDSEETPTLIFPRHFTPNTSTSAIHNTPSSNAKERIEDNSTKLSNKTEVILNATVEEIPILLDRTTNETESNISDTNLNEEDLFPEARNVDNILEENSIKANDSSTEADYEEFEEEWVDVISALDVITDILEDESKNATIEEVVSTTTISDLSTIDDTEFTDDMKTIEQ